MVERFPVKEFVGGSSPPPGAMINPSDLREQYNLITDAKVREGTKFDKEIFYTITGFFAFSLAFTQFLETPIRGVSLLLSSWAFNVLALLFHFFAYLCCIRDLIFTRNKIKKPHSSIEQLLENLGQKSRWAIAMEWFDGFRVVFLVIAIVLLLVFAFHNM